MSPRSKQLSESMRAQSIDALIKAARKLFAEQGYFNCKVSDIARDAGMSQGNVYWYFSSKEELLKAVLADGFETLGEVMLEASQKPYDSIAKLDALLDGLYEFVQERGEFNSIMLSLLGHGGDRLFLELGFDMSQIGAGYTHSVASIIAQAQDEGVISDLIDPTTLTMYFFAFFNGLNLTYDREWINLPRESVRSAVQRLVAMRTDTTSNIGGPK